VVTWRDPPGREFKIMSSVVEDDDGSDEDDDGSDEDDEGSDEDEDTACATCGLHSAEGMLLCDACERGYHMGCLRPPTKKVPEGDWYCWQCEELRRSDARFKSFARVRVYWPSYKEWFVGHVIGVRAATRDDVAAAAAEKKAVKVGQPFYRVFYQVDDIQWHVVSESEFLPVDGAATALARGSDALLGKRLQVWHKRQGNSVAVKKSARRSSGLSRGVA